MARQLKQLFWHDTHSERLKIQDFSLAFLERSYLERFTGVYTYTYCISKNTA